MEVGERMNLEQVGREVGQRLSEALWTTDQEAWKRLFTPDGSARQALWDCEDGWTVGYSTERSDGGPHHGKFVTLAYRPIGKGARSGNPTEWKRVYFRGFRTRKAAKQRATELYYLHSPKKARRAGWNGKTWDR